LKIYFFKCFQKSNLKIVFVHIMILDGRNAGSFYSFNICRNYDDKKIIFDVVNLRIEMPGKKLQLRDRLMYKNNTSCPAMRHVL